MACLVGLTLSHSIKQVHFENYTWSEEKINEKIEVLDTLTAARAIVIKDTPDDDYNTVRIGKGLVWGFDHNLAGTFFPNELTIVVEANENV